MGDLREHHGQVELADQHGPGGVADVKDVDVGRFFIVDEHRVGLTVGVPGEGAVDLVRVGRPLGQAVNGQVTEVLDQWMGVGRVGDIPKRHAAPVVVSATLVVVDQHVTPEAGRVDVDDLNSFTDVGLFVGGDETDLDGVGRVGNVDDVHASSVVLALAVGSREEAGEVGKVAKDRDVGDRSLFLGELELTDQVDAAELARPKQVAFAGPMLGVVALTAAVVELGFDGLLLLVRLLLGG